MTPDFTHVGELQLPRRMISLIDAGLWPNSPEAARRLDRNCSVPEERIHLLAPEENHLYLAAPPFYTIAELAHSDTANFWSRFGALEQIAPELSVDIGDFGLGSDTAIVIDYRQGGSNPPVLRLKWQRPNSNVWVRCANTFEEFADVLGLD
jgi:hypothetical protein